MQADSIKLKQELWCLATTIHKILKFAGHFKSF